MPCGVGQPLLRAVELHLADDGGHGGDQDPFGRVHRLRGSQAAVAHREQSRAAPRGRSGAGTVGKDLAEVGGVRQHAAQGRAVPGPVSPGRGDAQAIKTVLQGVERLTLVGEPGEQIAHHCSFGLVQPHACRVARPLGVEPVAVEWPRPGQQRAGALLAQAAATHPLADQGALILGHGAADLQQELVVRVAVHQPVEEHDLRPVPLQLLDQECLVHVVARQPIRLGDQDAVEPDTRGSIAQAVEAGPPEAGTAETVVAEDALGRQDPTLTFGMGAQAVELWLCYRTLGSSARSVLSLRSQIPHVYELS